MAVMFCNKTNDAALMFLNSGFFKDKT